MHGIFTQEVWEIEKVSHTLVEQIDWCMYTGILWFLNCFSMIIATYLIELSDKY